MISTFYQGNFQQKLLIINILPRLCMSTYAYAYVLVKTSLYICVGMVIACAAQDLGNMWSILSCHAWIKKINASLAPGYTAAIF